MASYISNLEEPIRRYLSQRHVRQFPFATVCHKIARRNETKKDVSRWQKISPCTEWLSFLSINIYGCFCVGDWVVTKKEEDILSI